MEDEVSGDDDETNNQFIKEFLATRATNRAAPAKAKEEAALPLVSQKPPLQTDAAAVAQPKKCATKKKVTKAAGASDADSDSDEEAATTSQKK